MACGDENHRGRKAAIFLSILMTGAIGGAASAQSFFERYMSPETAIAPCYIRVPEPDAPAERRQRLQTFVVEPQPNPRAKPPRTFRVALEFSVANSTDTFAGEADCETVGQQARCNIADGGGRFTLSPEGDGLKVTLGNRLELQGQEGFSPDLADGQDELVFLLRPGAAKACSIEPVALRVGDPAVAA